MSVRNTRGRKVFNAVGFLAIAVVAALCLFPFALLVSGSLSSNESVVRHGYSILPRDFSWEAYAFIFKFPEDILRAYGVSTFVTVAGTAIGLFLISMTGYVLQRGDFRYRNKISFYFYFTTIFQGGLIPWYILLVNFLKMKDSYTVLIWNLVMSPFLIILMRSFIKGAVPTEIVDSAKIDGADDFRIYRSIVLPVCKPALATVGLFLALAYWNDWFSCALFIDDRQKFTLQFFLYNALTATQYINQLAASGANIVVQVPGETAKLAMAIIAMGPILFLYTFLQRYFIKGITVGAVKG